MKRLFTLILMHWFAIGISQVPIPSYHLFLSPRMTTNIIFPYRIEKADIGSADVVGQKAGKRDNVLLIKGRRKDFPPTNLSVYTSDGKFYSFVLGYKKYPDTLNISFANIQTASPRPSALLTDEKLDNDAVLIAGEKSYLNKRLRIEGIKASLHGIYLKDHLSWFRLEIRNVSNIDYEPEYVKFSVQYKHGAKRTAVQEIQMEPSWQKDKKVIPGQSSDTLILAFPSFTIEGDKKLVIQIVDKNGEREIHLAVSAKSLLKARNVKR